MPGREEDGPAALAGAYQRSLAHVGTLRPCESDRPRLRSTVI